MTEKYIQAFALYNWKKHEIDMDKNGRLKIYCNASHALDGKKPNSSEVRIVYILISEDDNEKV